MSIVDFENQSQLELVVRKERHASPFVAGGGDCSTIPKRTFEKQDFEHSP